MEIGCERAAKLESKKKTLLRAKLRSDLISIIKPTICGTMQFNSARNLEKISQATSKKAVLKIFQQCFISRHASPPHPPLLKNTIANFQLSSEEEASTLIKAVKECIKCSLYDPLVSIQEFCKQQLPASEVDARVAKLIQNILENCAPEWQECCVLGRVGLPKLVESNWRVDVEGEGKKQ